ncbi:MAG: hypothetical protein M4579_003240 [Chaenotheca gracillima]|nr:MAG: hypothetical protein M4579_003240 [Chaenotheca gracillima]
MQCAICSRSPNSKLQFHCVACARYSLYDLRIRNAAVLLEREAQGRQVDGIVAREEDDLQSKQGNVNKEETRWDIQTAAARADESAERTRESQAHSETLRREIEISRAETAKRRAELARRRSVYASATEDPSSRRTMPLESAEKSIRRASYRWDQQHQKMAESRVFLCREAAELYGLRQRRRRKGGVIKEDYFIGGICIVDLRDINTATPSQITTSINHVAHLLTLTSHYLSLQMPAQIILPHRDYPLPTIFSPSSSYFPRDVPFPGSTPIHSSNTSPSASRNSDFRPLPRPRPLYLDKPLPVLAKEDQVAYSLFIEGITLLAWDIAWVCRSQGLNIASTSWEDVCPLGRNLWQLLVATPYQQAPQKALTSITKDVSSKNTPRKIHTTPSGEPVDPRLHPTLGHYSHGSAHSFLGAAEGSDYMRSWKLQGPMKIVDKLKSALLGEMAGAEWEMLDEKEWDDSEQKEGEAAVLIGGHRASEQRLHDPERKPDSPSATIQSSDAEGDRGSAAESSKGRGGNGGWMKLKPRQTSNNT